MADTLLALPVTGGTLNVDTTALQSALSLNNTVLEAAILAALSNSTFTPSAVVVTPPPPPPPSTAAAKKARIIAYLKSLGTAASKCLLIGQTAAIWSQPLSSTPLDEAPIAAVKTATGKDVAIAGLILNYATNSWAVTPANTETEVAQYLATGALVHLSLYWNMPTTGGGSAGAAPQGSTWDAADFHATVTPGTTQNTNMKALIAQAITGLKACVGTDGVVLLRPFIEINGNWNWYGAESGPDFIALWMMVYNALQAAGILDNVILVWCINQNVGNYTTFYPGKNQVDVVSLDVYATPGELVQYINTAYPALVAYDQPLMLSEYGGSDNAPTSNNTLDNMALLGVVKSTFPKIIGFVQFNGTWAIAANQNATALMNDPRSVTLGDLPSGI